MSAKSVPCPKDKSDIRQPTHTQKAVYKHYKNNPTIVSNPMADFWNNIDRLAITIDDHFTKNKMTKDLGW